MALLTDTQRWEVWRDFMIWAGNMEETFGAFIKEELRTAVDETDTWLESGGKGSHKNQLSQPCKSELTTSQLSKMKSVITIKRSG